MSQYRIKPRRQRPYKPISARMINTMADLANDQRVVAGPGVVSFAWPGGTVIQADGSTSGAWYFAYSPMTGIPARTGTPPGDLTPGSASCVIYSWTGSVLTLVASKSYVTRNAWKTAIGGNRLVRVTYGRGSWWVVNQDCGEGSTSTTPTAQPFSPDFSSDFARTTSVDPTGTDFSLDFGSDFGLSMSGREHWSLTIGGGAPTVGVAGFIAAGGLGYANLQWDSTAAEVRSALDTVWGAGSVLTWGGPWPGTAIEVLWIGEYDRADLVSASWGAVTFDAGTPSLTVVASGTGTGNETQCIYAAVNATAGTFTANLGGYGASGPIAYNASAATVQAALDAWLGTGQSTVFGGPLPTYPIGIHFKGTMAGLNLSSMIIGVSFDFDGTYQVGTVANGVP